MFFYCFIPFVISVVLTLFFLPRLMYISREKGLFDIPDSRKIHEIPVSRLGGLTFFPVTLMSAFVSIIVGLKFLLESHGVYIYPDGIYMQFMFFVVGQILLYFVGVMDDLVGVRYQSKFIAEIIAASLLPIGGLWIKNLHGILGIYELTPYIGIPLTIFIVIYVINAINLIDGIDGLASGLCILSFATLGGCAIVGRQNFIVVLTFAMIGALMAFWNANVFGKAEKGRKIFMGDTGAITLGYFLSFVGLYLSDIAGKENIPNGMLLICFSTLIIPLFDIVRVMVIRMKNHRNPFLPDRNHIHHLLMRAGMDSHKVLGTLMCASLLFIGLTVIGVFCQWNLTLVFLLNLLLWGVLNVVVMVISSK